jgi:hypothetical protein
MNITTERAVKTIILSIPLHAAVTETEATFDGLDRRMRP